MAFQIPREAKWILRIVFGLVFAYLVIAFINDRTAIFSNLIPETFKHRSEEELVIKYLKQDLHLSQGNLKASETRLTESNQEIRKLKSEISSRETRISDLAAMTEQLKNDKASLEKRTREPASLKLEQFVKQGSIQLNSLPIINLDWKRHNKALQGCAVDTKKLLFAWLRFYATYRHLNLDDLEYDDKNPGQLKLANIKRLSEIPHHQYVWLAPLATKLLEYHKILTAKDDWQSTLGKLNSSSYRSQIIDMIYRAGYPKSKDPCLTDAHSISIETADRGYHLPEVQLERWLYTFWLRRFDEGTMDVVYLTLRLFEQLANDASPYPEQQYIYDYPLFPDAELQAGNSALIDTYRQFLIARRQGDHIVFWVNDRQSSPAPEFVFQFLGDNHGKGIAYAGQVQSPKQDSEKHYGHLFDLADENSSSGQLFTTRNFARPVNAYSGIETSATVRDKIRVILQQRFKHARLVEDNAQDAADCSLGGGKTRSFASGENKIHLHEVSCSKWTGEGHSGPHLSLVFGQKSQGELAVRHQYIGLSGHFSIMGDYLADLDKDGNIEVYINVARGVRSTTYLAELNGNDWLRLRDSIERSEGGGDEYLERSNNQKLLFSE